MQIPTCEVPACTRPAGIIKFKGKPDSIRKTGKPHVKEFIGVLDRNPFICTTCHAKFKNSPHILKRKKYCENIDGRLGFKCTSKIIDHKWQCTVDHINGKHYDNRDENLQTLCHNCHAIKTRNNEDWRSK